MLDSHEIGQFPLRKSQSDVCAELNLRGIQEVECTDKKKTMNENKQDTAAAKNIQARGRPCQRVLTVLIHIGKYGPTSMDQIADGLGLHKSTVWRSIEALKGMDLVRVQRGTGLLELKNLLSEALHGFHFADHRVEATDEIVSRLQNLRYTFVDVGMFKGPGIFRLQETTRRGQTFQSHRSLIFDSLAIAAQLTLPLRTVEMHLREYPATDPQEAYEIRTGSHMKLLEKMRESWVIWADDGASCAISVPYARGVAIGAEIYRPTKQRVERLRQAVSEIVSGFPPIDYRDGQDLAS